MQLIDGSLLYEGKYRIIQLLSQDKLGYTYKAICANGDSKVAIKELYLSSCCQRHPYNGEVSASSLEKVELFEKMKRRFVEEARTLLQFSHPNIVRVVDVFLHNGTAYYVMDYIQGENLQQIVQQNGPLREDLALGYMDQICDAVDYIHSKSRLHLDICPSNVVISQQGQAYLKDFGISKLIDFTDRDISTSLLNMVPKGYASIEVEAPSSGVLTPVADVYSLGATLYKLLTGITPPEAVMLVNYPLGDLPQGVSAHVAATIKRAMSPNRAERPQSVRDFKRMLHSASAATSSNSYISGNNTDGPAPSGNSHNPSGVTYNNSFSSRSGEFQNNSLDDDEATIVTPDPHQGSIMSQIDFHFDSLDDESTTIDPNSNQGGNSGNGGSSGNSGNGGRSGGGNRGSGSSGNSGNRTGGRSGRTSGRSGATNGSGNKLLRAIAIIVAVLAIGAGCYWAYDRFLWSPGSNTSTELAEGGAGLSLGNYAQNDPSLMGEINGHNWIDLGLPSGVKWATTNVGAEYPFDLGGYYAWGETQTKDVYSYDNAVTYDKPTGEVSDRQGYDAALAQWGQGWSLPTKEDFEELLQNCSYRWVEIDDVRGGLFTSRKNGQSIFLPASGFRYGVITSDTDASYVGTEGSYWSGSPTANVNDHENAYGLRLYGNSIQTLSDKFHRGAGRSIRAVAR